MRKKLISFLLVISLLMPISSFAWLSDGGAGWANYPYIVKILIENIKRYQQLRHMIGQAKDAQNFVKLINKGIDNAVGLMQVLPIKDEKLLAQFKEFSSALKKIDELYGAIPKSDDEAMQRLHDKTIAESFKIVNALTDYANRQEINAVKIHSQSSSASPKGAARINAQANAQILHSLNQLIKINGQILKLQGENFAMANMHSKNSSESFNKSNNDLKKVIKKFKTTSSLPRF